jgi:1-acyl-sn-glycerol-3-phosphate acyltransferase
LIQSIENQRPNGLMQALARLLLRLLHFRLDITLPDNPRFVIIGAPHTSNWDLIYAMLIKYGAGIQLHWLGKDSLFRNPFGSFMRWLGGIPVVRDSRSDYVGQIARVFEQHKNFILAIAPEGTRSLRDHWKTGFYYIALKAQVPVALGFVDFRTRTIGIGPSFYPSGDIQADFAKIQEFYANKVGRHPKMQGPVRLKEE